MFRLRLKVKNSKVIYLLFLAVLFSACASMSSMKLPYYWYSIGRVHIENPVLVSCLDGNYVCPDSSYYCCTTEGWTERDDVFPYVLTTQELLDTVKPIKFVNDTHRLRRIDNGYYPYNTDSVIEMRSGNDVFYIHRFMYNLDTFDVYMESSSGEYYDESDPLGIDSGADQMNAFRYGTNCYRITLRAHYTYSQILKMRRLYKNRPILEYYPHG